MARLTTANFPELLRTIPDEGVAVYMHDRCVGRFDMDPNHLRSLARNERYVAVQTAHEMDSPSAYTPSAYVASTYVRLEFEIGHRRLFLSKTDVEDGGVDYVRHQVMIHKVPTYAEAFEDPRLCGWGINWGVLQVEPEDYATLLSFDAYEEIETDEIRRWDQRDMLVSMRSALSFNAGFGAGIMKTDPIVTLKVP